MLEQDITSKTDFQNIRGSQSISRATSLLRSVAKLNEKGARLSEVAHDTGLSPSTAYRMLSTLVVEGLLSYDKNSKLYHLGFELYRLGVAAHQFAIRDRFRMALEKIERETEDTIFLLIRSGYDALCIDRVEGRYPIRAVHIDIGSRRPLGIGASGVALIAFMPPQERETLIAANEKRYPYYNGLTGNPIRKMVAEAEKRGYAVSRGLFIEGVNSVGVPIVDDQKNVVAAITVSAIRQRMNYKRCEDIYRLVKKIVKE